MKTSQEILWGKLPGATSGLMIRLTSVGSSEELRGFWIHLDADVINPTVLPAVDSPEPGGPTIEDW